MINVSGYDDVKGFEPAEEDTVILIGAGAVADAWDPVLDALGTRIPERAADVANVYFATLVHRLRWVHSMAVKPGLKTNVRAMYERYLAEARAELTEVTTAIATHISAWDGNKLRPEAELIRSQLLSPIEGCFGVVTTNWDFSALEFLEGAYEQRCSGVDYIHGTYEIGLYLPGEVVDESYRDRDGRDEMFNSALSTVHMLRDVQRLIVYGLSVSPLDGELGFLLQSAARQRRRPLEEVVVVDPNHANVIRNLRVHIGDQNYVGVLPWDLKDLKLPR